MTIQLTIIGLGQIGGSIGLALGSLGDKIERTGTDIERGVMSQAKTMGAVDKTTPDLNSAVKDADIVILAVPLDQVKEVIDAIAPVIKAGALVMETSPVKVKLSEWVMERLPESCGYVGLTPVLNPKYLHSETFGIQAAKADLFKDGLFCVVTPSEAKPQAIQTAIDLIEHMDASPLFFDLYEIDGLMAAVHFLPQLMSVALLNSTLDQPGWNEARKIAGRAFAEVTGPAAHLDDAEAIKTATEMNKENITRKLDDIILTLQTIREEIAQDELEGFESRLKEAKAGVDTWWKERGGGNWLAEELPRSDLMPRSSEVMGNLLGFGLGRKKKKDRDKD